MPVSSYIKDDNMAMKFFEVFDGIHFEERLSALMEDTTVEKLTTDSQRTLLRVYLSLFQPFSYIFLNPLF